MNWDFLILPILGIAAIAYLAIFYWNEVAAEREEAPQDKDVHAKVGIRLALRILGLSVHFLVESGPFSLILLIIAYAWWEANKSILAPALGAIGGSLAIWQIVHWTNRSRANRRVPPPDHESPPEPD